MKAAAQTLQIKTAELSAQLGIADQLNGMTTPQKLREIGRRFNLVRKLEAARMCEELATLAIKYGA